MIKIETGGLLCGNCCKQLEEDSGTDTIKINGTDPGEVQIVDALAYIFGISSRDDSLTSTKAESYPKSSSELNYIYAAESSVYFCDSCAIILSKKYRLHKELESSRHPSSVVHRLEVFLRRNRNRKSKKYSQSLETNYNFLSDFPNHQIENDNTRVSFDSFPFDDWEDEDHYETNSPEIEFKPEFNVELQNSEPGCKRHISKLKPTQSTVTSHLQLPQLSVKLEKLSPEMIAKFARYANRVTRTRKRTKLRNKSALRKRLKSLQSRRVEQNCRICGKMMTSKKRMKRHLLIVHRPKNNEEKEKPSLRKSQCYICGKVLTTGTGGLKRHLVVHEEDTEMFKCDICGKSYLRKTGYDEHMLSHSESFTPFTCEECGKTFATKAILRDHAKIHIEAEFPCDLCSRVFPTRKYMLVHKRRKHVEPIHPCDQCGKFFKEKCNLLRHLKLHKEVEERGGLVNCDVCGRRLKNGVRLEDHKRRIHRVDLKKV